MKIERITDIEEKKTWLDYMVSYKRAFSLPAHVLRKAIEFYFIDLPAAWTKTTPEHPEDEWYQDDYRDFIKRNGRPWNHVGDSHTILGMQFAEWHYRRGIEVNLGDSPDFWFEIDDHDFTVYGDIGACTPTALLRPLISMKCSDLWISVLGNTQIIVEFGHPAPRDVFHSNIGEISSCCKELGCPTHYEREDVVADI